MPANLMSSPWSDCRYFALIVVANGRCASFAIVATKTLLTLNLKYLVHIVSEAHRQNHLAISSSGDLAQFSECPVTYKISWCLECILPQTQTIANSPLFLAHQKLIALISWLFAAEIDQIDHLQLPCMAL